MSTKDMYKISCKVVEFNTLKDLAKFLEICTTMPHTINVELLAGRYIVKFTFVEKV